MLNPPRSLYRVTPLPPLNESMDPVPSLRPSVSRPDTQSATVFEPTRKRQRQAPVRPIAFGPVKAINDDRLGKIVESSVKRFRRAPSWSRYVYQSRGRSHLARGVKRLPHRAATYLEFLRVHGSPVEVSDDPWSASLLSSRLERGPHKSAVEYADFVRDEMADFCDKGFWTVLPYDLVKDYPQLRLSPLGVVPQRERRPRLIVDLSFWDVNQNTVQHAPPEAMQFGRTLQRLLRRIRHANPRFGPVYMSKIDISDGFYRIQLGADDALALAVLLPSSEGEPPLVAIPLSLPMGWVESPPTFCAATETAADLANARYSGYSRAYCRPHRLDEPAASAAPATSDSIATTPGTGSHRSLPVPQSAASAAQIATPPGPGSHRSLPGPQTAAPAALRTGSHRSLPVPQTTTRSPFSKPLSYTDVYVDDFISLIQGSRRRRRYARRVLMHTIDEIFRPLDESQGSVHKEPISVKKLRQGDASWTTVKVVLGWVIDTVQQTLTLPAHRVLRLREIFDSLRGARRVSIKKWHQVLGELRSMVLAIPGGKGLFSILQTGFRYSDRSRVRIDADMRAQLDDFECLATEVSSRPTRLAEIVPDLVTGIGSVDAAGTGMGGVWFTPHGQPIVWRAPFPDDLRRRLVSWKNPTGDLTNSDLELASVVTHQDVLAQAYDVREATIAILNDNTPAVSRSTRGSITSRDAASYLLRLSSLHQRHFRYLATYDHISGLANKMADDASRLWHLSDAAFLAHFEQQYPQTRTWRLCPPRSEMLSSVISALRKQRRAPQSFLNAPGPVTAPGASGRLSATPLVSIPCSKMWLTPSSTSWSSPRDTGMEALRKMVTPSDLAQWKTFSVPSARRWPAWGPRTTGSWGPGRSTIASPSS